ncbi:glycosyltransferase family 2 protein [Phormidium yuhuli AB48]|uniref:Glycosyltransferase family 2 protein n=1 Tax=Phormidium yuhuli AB48 TaxID=2940671 RepID=A0ABY5AUG3_9CYAN|nr:glycosyltransferase family A protein [Phormidium yuhuli]USR91773.1 glycosyltransferase family 2 protein [Phormidium yuhuli AB48]
MSVVKPQVSVIIPVYNGGRFLGEAIASVWAQTYTDWELIVVDDGSTEAIEPLIAPYGSRLRYIRQENQGVAVARNRGLEVARGEFIAFLDQDDWFEPDKFEVQVAALQESPHLGMVHSGWFVVDAAGERLSTVNPREGIPELDLAAWLLWKPVFLGAMLFRRSGFEEVGGFNKKWEKTPDVALVLQLILKGYRADWVSRPTVSYRQHPGNASRETRVQVRECKQILDEMFAHPHLPPEVRGLESQARYNNLVWSAWRLYSTGEFSLMTDYLRKSLAYSEQSRTETILDWLRWFEQYEAEYGQVFDYKILVKKLIDLT